LAILQLLSASSCCAPRCLSSLSGWACLPEPIASLAGGITMQPEDRATAERLWGFYTQQAQSARLAAASSNPFPPVDILIMSNSTLLRLAAERDYWREQAQSQAGAAPPLATAPRAVAAATRPQKAPASRNAPRAAAPRKSAKGRPPSQNTPERMQLLRDLWMDPALTARQIKDRLNALPGPRIGYHTSCYGWAKTLGLPTIRPEQRPFPAPSALAEPVASEPEAPVALPPKQATPATPAAATPHTAKPATAAPQQTSALPRLPITKRDEWEEAADLLAAGMSVVEVSREMDLPKTKVSELYFKMRRDRDEAEQGRRSA
jgi:hypothetical protein